MFIAFLMAQSNVTMNKNGASVSLQHTCQNWKEVSVPIRTFDSCRCVLVHNTYCINYEAEYHRQVKSATFFHNVCYRTLWGNQRILAQLAGFVFDALDESAKSENLRHSTPVWPKAILIDPEQWFNMWPDAV